MIRRTRHQQEAKTRSSRLVHFFSIDEYKVRYRHDGHYQRTLHKTFSVTDERPKASDQTADPTLNSKGLIPVGAGTTS